MTQTIHTTRIDDLIQQYCPNGVPRVRLREVVERVHSLDWSNARDQKFAYIDLSSVDRSRHVITETETISESSAPSRARQIVQVGDVLFGTTRPMLRRYCLVPDAYDGQIASTGFCVLRPMQSHLLPNFLFHFLGTAEFYAHIEANERGASYPAISDKLVKEFRIPVPPLVVQEEIVRILDTFTQLEAELEAELEARRQQYEHYRHLLLGEDALNGETKVQLDDLFEMRAGTHVRAAEISDVKTPESPYPCYGGNGLRGFVSSFNYDESVLLIGRQGALCGNVHRADGKIYATEHAVVVTPRTTADMSWAFHKLTEMDLNQFKTKSAQPGLAVARIKRLEVYDVPLETQQRDGAILDQFDVLINDLSSGLPAELIARRQQYEYYRDRLLSFEELSA